MSKALFAMSAAALITGCAPLPQLSREEWINTTTRTYDGVSKEQVIAAAERVFRLADGDDFSITHTQDGIYASRNWLAYIVIAAVTGTDYWQVNVVPDGSRIKATIQLSTQTQGTSPIATTNGTWTATTMPTLGAPAMGTAIYDLFWRRMDYLLRKRPDWTSCQAADELVSRKLVNGSNEALCNSFNIKDETPLQPMI